MRGGQIPYVMAWIIGNNKIMVQQLDQLRSYMALVFQKETELAPALSL